MKKALVALFVSIAFLFSAGVAASAQEGLDDDGPGPMMSGILPHCELLSFSKRAIAADDFAMLKKLLMYAAAPAEVSWDGKSAWKVLPKRLDPAFASSSLKADNFGTYDPWNATDMEVDSAWVEGVKGSGIGEWLAWRADYLGSTLAARMGYGTTAWKLNNRVKDARIRVFAIGTEDFSSPLPEKDLLVSSSMLDMKISFDDYDGWAYADLPETLESPGQYLAVMEILSVYKGDNYDDTCVSEIGFTVMQ
jgi:hypothetical protein